MQIQREDANGDLYQMSLYSSGVLFGMSPRRRAGRKRLTSEAKREINKRQAKWRLMQLIHANFKAGRDLFVCLTYGELPGSEARCLERFHREVKARYAKIGLEYWYIAATESHNMDGCGHCAACMAAQEYRDAGKARPQSGRESPLVDKVFLACGDFEEKGQAAP